METNDNINLLLEMIDNPDSYSEQEIQDIINRDDETRETYRQLVRARRAGRHHHATSRPVDVDTAWQRFEQGHFALPERRNPWLKVAAAVAGILLLSGIAWAASLAVRHVVDGASTSPVPVSAPSPARDGMALGQPTAGDTNSNGMMEVTFDNVPLDSMLGEIADHYGMAVEFRNSQARQLRFHFVWDKGDGLEKVVEDINHFESVDIEQTGNRLIVR